VSIVGLDIGTTGTKAVAFRPDGQVLASAYREYDMLSPEPGQLELDPREVLEAIRTVLREVASRTTADPPQSLAWCTLGEAMVPVDEAGEPLGNAIIGFDCRGEEEAEYLRSELDPLEVFSLTGHPVNSYHSVCKLLWWRNNRPEVYARARQWLCIADFFVRSLGLPPAIDYSLASRMLLFDVKKYVWSERLLGLAGIEAGQLARPVAPGEAIGPIGKNDFGFPETCVVGAGLHDQPAGIVGTGTAPGEAMYAIGTVVCLGVRLAATPDPAVMIRNNLCLYPTYGAGQYVSLAWNFTGGSLLKWYRDQFAAEERAEAERTGKDVYDIICGSIPDTPTSLLVLPYFTTTGTPYLDTRARGAILGLHLTTERREIARAILEGVNYDIRLNTAILAEAGVSIDRYKAIGGAARSPVWMQLAACILGRPVVTLQATEGASFGAALMGAKAAGLIEDPESVGRELARPDRVYEPSDDFHRAYQERFALYRKLYEANRPLLHELDRMARSG
jgi:xylulokinase